MFNKIVHLQFAGPYSEGYNYQENILPKFQRNDNNDVQVWTSNFAWDKGELKEVPLCDKLLNDGVRLVRFKYKTVFNSFLTNKIRYVSGVYKRLIQEKPDFIMLHDVQTAVLPQVARYLSRYPNVKVIVDCHTDFSNSARNFLSKNILHKVIYKSFVKLIDPYVYKFYGTLPARVDFLVDVYGVDRNKCDLLVMGADDDIVSEVLSNNPRQRIRNQYGIDDSEFLVVTGGKLDRFKTQTLSLMRAIHTLNSNVKLIVFGSIDPCLIDEFNELVDNKQIFYAGWLDGFSSYEYFASADLVVFPGRHSVYWEQAAGLGVPLVVKYWEGTNHVDLGGNVAFLYDDSVEEIRLTIGAISSNNEIYNTMKRVALEKGIEYFSYRKIAQRCLTD